MDKGRIRTLDILTTALKEFASLIDCNMRLSLAIHDPLLYGSPIEEWGVAAKYSS
jgi:hypothetical protein